MDIYKDNIDTFKLDRNYIFKSLLIQNIYNLREEYDTKFDIINILGKLKKNLDPKIRFY
jgi:hypothetical protein